MTAIYEVLDQLQEIVESGEPRLRLLMPKGGRIGWPKEYRWVREINGHPGHCAEDCWHSSVEAALAHFRGEGVDA